MLLSTPARGYNAWRPFHVERGETNLSIDNLERLPDALTGPAAELLLAEVVAPLAPAAS